MPERFQNDVFVSYRRVANGNPDHWVDQFCAALRNNLIEMLGRDVTIWRDVEQLRIADIWRKELWEAIDDSAIFLALFSASYFESDECRREFDRFRESIKKKDAASALRKLFPVYKQPLNAIPAPPKDLGALQSHEFFHRSPGAERYIELGPQTASAGERNFWTSLSWLAQDIQKSLDTLDKDGESTALGKVFVSCVCPELDARRAELRADLQQRGYVVLPRHEYIWSEPDNPEDIAADLEEALISVHLVTGALSIEPDAPARSRLQLALAQRGAEDRARRAPGDDPRPTPLVWIRPSAGIDPSAAELIDAVRGEFANAGVEYLSGSFEALKTEVYAKLGEVAARRGPPRIETEPAAPLPSAAGPAGSAALEAALPDVALIVEAGEVGATDALNALLADRLGVAVRQITFVGVEPKDAERMKKALAACPRCIVFWAGQPREWLDDVLDHPLLASHLGRTTLCVHLDGPRTPEKAVFRSPRATVVEVANADVEAGLRVFLGR